MIVSLSNSAAVSCININNYVSINSCNVKDCVENIKINFDINVNGYLF